MHGAVEGKEERDGCSAQQRMQLGIHHCITIKQKTPISYALGILPELHLIYKYYKK